MLRILRFFRDSHANQLRLANHYFMGMHVKSIPNIKPLDFFQFVCNCFGIWFGLSVMSVNPFTNLRKRHKNREERSWSHFFKIKIITILSLTFIIGCILGFVVQTAQFSRSYFAYKTTSRIEVESTDDLRYPNIVFCSRYDQLINWKNTNYTQNQTNDLTVKQIFDMTPEKKHSLKGCTMRDDETEEMKYQGSEACLKMFHTIKFISGADVCYGYIPHGEYLYSQRKVTSAMTDLGIIYKLHLSDIFSQASHPTFITYFVSSEFMKVSTPDKWLPIQSRSFADRLVADANTSNYFIFQGIFHNISLLPEPYDTMCTYDERMVSCPQDCNIQYKKHHINRLPFNEILFHPQDLRILSEDDFKNETIKRIVSEGIAYCDKICWQTFCDYDYAMTEIAAYSDNKMRKTISLVAAVPKANGLAINSFPIMTLINYLNNIGVTASIWFGVSILSLSLYPFKLLGREVNRRRNKCRTGLGRNQQNLKKKESNPNFYHFLGSKRNESKMIPVPRIYCPCSFCQKFFKHKCGDSSGLILNELPTLRLRPNQLSRIFYF